MEDTKEYEKYLEDSDFLKWGIIISRLVWNKSYAEITDALGVVKSYISKVLKKFREDEGIHDHRVRNGGHNKKMHTPVKSLIQEFIEEDRSLSGRKLTAQLSTEIKLEISCTTVRKQIKSLGYKKSKPLLVPFLSNNAKEKRLDYCLQYCIRITNFRMFVYGRISIPTLRKSPIVMVEFQF